MHYTSLYHLAYRYLANHHLTEDVLSISFTKAFRKIKKFRCQGKGSFKKWLNTIVINESIRLLQKNHKTAIAEITYDIIPEQTDNQNNEVELDVEMVYLFLEEIPTLQRLVFNLFVIEGYSYKEIATMIGITEANSKTLLSRAKSTIRHKLTNQHKHEEENRSK